MTLSIHGSQTRQHGNASLVHGVANYRREGMQALNELTRSARSILTSITEQVIIREEHTAEADARLGAEATITTRMDSFGQLIAQAIASCSSCKFRTVIRTS